MSVWFNFVNKGETLTTEIYIYGAIVDYKWDETDPEVTPVEFRDELEKAKDAKTIHLFVNSPGGNVFAGLSIYNMLKRHPANKIGHVDGIAASISSVILMACNKIISPKTAMMLVHKPLIAGFVVGNANDLMRIAGDLDKVEIPIIEAYVGKTGLKAEKIKEIMEKDAYMTGEESVNSGFADSIDDSKSFTAAIDSQNVIVNGQTHSIKNFHNFPIDKAKSIFLSEKTEVSNEKSPKPEYSMMEYQLMLNNNNL